MAGTDTTVFKHTPLDDPKHQIRLLSFNWDLQRFLSPDGSWELKGREDDNGTYAVISCSLSTWNLERAPRYRAISYTWGDTENLQTIAVDGQLFTIRDNCDYALWQVGHHWPNEYFWIDSICFNQADNDEKGPQVAMMGDIFSAAWGVCACVGPPDDSTPSLLAILDLMDEYGDFDDQKMSDAGINTFVSSLKPNDKSVAGFCIGKSHNIYPKLPFYTWLWAFQEHRLREFGLAELHSSRRQGLYVCCGLDFIDFGLLDALASFFAAGKRWAEHYDPVGRPPSPHDRWDFWRYGNHFSLISAVVSEKEKTWQNFVRYLTDFDCADIRDKVYGTLGLFDWTNGGLAIVPDYDLLPADLALMIVERSLDCRIEEVEDILKVLDLYDASAVTSWANAKRDVVARTPGAFAPVDKHFKASIWSDPALVILNHDGETYCDFRIWHSTRYWHGSGELSEPWRRIHTGPNSSIQADRPVIPGDILVETEYAALALRPRGVLGCSDLEVVARLRAGDGSSYKIPGEKSLSERCWCFGCIGIKVEFTINALDMMELAAYGALSDRDAHKSPANIPRTGTIVRDVSKVYYDGDYVHRPALTHLLTCPYVKDIRQPPPMQEKFQQVDEDSNATD